MDLLQEELIGNLTEAERLNCAEKANATLPEGWCPAVFDGWRCWSAASAGTAAFASCPGFIPGFDTKLFAHRECTENATWFRHPESGKEWSNYTTCVNQAELLWKQTMISVNEFGYMISLIALLVSLFILSYFKSLRCTRITLHINLFGSFAVNNALWLLFYRLVIPKTEVYLENGTWCQALHIVTHYFLMSNYCWMLCEGLYLHTLLVNAFAAEERLVKWLYLLGWAVPGVIIVLYASLRASSSDPEVTEQCWMNESPYNLVLAVPVCLSMFLNFVFLCNIVRVLWMKLRAGPQVGGHASQPSRTLLQAFRATLLLLPLLGLQYLLTPFRPEKDHPWERVYEVTSAITASFQGLCVATLFCFFNGEVLAQMRRRFQFLFSRTRTNSYTNTTVSVRRISLSARHPAQNQVVENGCNEPTMV